jgi:pseudouridine-5'-phosphate glycosidase
MKMLSEFVQVSGEVKEALAKGEPVVALETTIIAHGMPYPTNVDTALQVEETVRANGGIPATVGIIGGTIVFGLSKGEIEFMGISKEVYKAGERDLPLIVTRRLHAATTAGATLAIASSAGARVFVTGGIGGVGPGAGQTFDISADLQAMARYPCITVCAGTKAFMDIAATLEYLETYRVPVVVYRSTHFPFFYSRNSGIRAEWVAHDLEEIADFFATKLAMGLEGGMLVGVPIPPEDALSEEITRRAIRVALQHIEEKGITGKEVTPFLLGTIKEETGGKSLMANIALVKNNAKVGTRIAVALSRLCVRHR